MKVAITTSKDDFLLISRAEAYAAELAIPYINRQRSSLDNLRSEYSLDYVLIVEQDRVILKGATSLAWHPSMAVPRLKALREGSRDPMVDALDLKPGYSVLDCTLGLGADALVAASIVGKQGSVTGLEADKYIAFITKLGMQNFSGQNIHIKAIVDRVTVINQTYEEYLPVQLDNSYDVVYFDPMFRYSLIKSAALNALRPLARHAPLTENVLREALRVARYRVVLKENAKSREFARLNAPLVSGGRYSSIAYGIWIK